MDFEFFTFCINIITFFKKEGLNSEVAKHLIRCLDAEVLLRDEYEIILRILINESNCRDLNLRDYLLFVRDNVALRPELININIDCNDITEDS